MRGKRGLRQRLAGIHPLVWIIGALAAGALIAWPLGGWDTVQPSSAKIPVIEAGQTHSAQQFATRIVSATIGAASPGGLAADSGDAYLIVTADVTDLTDESVSAFRDLLRVEGVKADGADTYVASDTTSAPALGPGLRTRILFAWKVPAAQFVAGQRLTVSILDKRPLQSAISIGTIWIDPEVAARVSVTLQPGPSPAPNPFAEDS